MMVLRWYYITFTLSLYDACCWCHVFSVLGNDAYFFRHGCSGGVWLGGGLGEGTLTFMWRSTRQRCYADVNIQVKVQTPLMLLGAWGSCRALPLHPIFLQLFLRVFPMYWVINHPSSRIYSTIFIIHKTSPLFLQSLTLDSRTMCTSFVCTHGSGQWATLRMHLWRKMKHVVFLNIGQCAAGGPWW